MPLRYALRRCWGRKKVRGCIYARYSTRFQHSLEDQVRACQAWAAQNDVEILDLHVFTDAGKSGRRRRRAGLDAMLRALDRGEIDVVITFATNRLHRKIHLALQFVEEEIVEKRRRCIFVAQNIDTADQRFWKALIYVFAMLDEFGVQMTAGHVREAHIGLLRRSLVHGTLTFGYMGVPIEGEFTKRGKPRRRWEIDAEAGKWVLRIFESYVHERLRYSDIARRLRKEHAPLPPKVGKWTWRAVKHVLKNRRYIGDWSYGRSETIWQSKADYGRQFPKDKPTHEYAEERLRLIDDVTFLRAQERIARKEGQGGRPAQSGIPIRDIVLEVMRCPEHKCKLTSFGSGGEGAACLACKRELDPERQFLFSLLNRKVARRLLCQRLAAELGKDAALIDRAVAAARHQIDVIRNADPAKLQALEAELQSLSKHIGFILLHPGESDTDRAENGHQLDKLRARRSEVERKIAQERAASTATPENIPSEDELRGILADLGHILTKAAESDDEAVLGKAMAIIYSLTGGEVMLSQHGERRPKKGWLRGTFQLRLVHAVLSRSGFNLSEQETAGSPIEIDFRDPCPAEELAEDAMALWGQDLLVREIAKKLSIQRGEPISGNLVRLAIAHWHESRGLPKPDGRSRRATLRQKSVDPYLYQKIADAVMELYNQGLLLGDIATRLPVVDAAT